MKRDCDENSRLLERVERGDEGAIAALYDRFSSHVYSVAHRVLLDPARAELILSDIFMEIWRRPERFMQMTEGLLLSLVMIARNRSITMRLNKPASDLDFVPPDWTAQHECHMSPEEASATFKSLPMERRTLLEKVFFDGTIETAIDSQRSSLRKSDECSIKNSAVSKLAETGVEEVDRQTDPLSMNLTCEIESGMELRDLLEWDADTVGE